MFGSLHCPPLLETIDNAISMNTDPSRLPLYMNIGMNSYHKYLRY